MTVLKFASQTELEAKARFLVPTPGRLIVQEDDFVYKGKLIIPETAKSRPSTGRVVAICPEDSLELRAGLQATRWLGKRVLFAQYTGIPIRFQGRPAYIVMSYDEIACEVAAEDEELLTEEAPPKE